MLFELCYYSYEFLASFLPYAALLLWLQRKQGRWTLGESLLLMLLGVYIVCVFDVTGAGTLAEGVSWGFRYMGRRINLIPFSQEIHILGYVLNVVMLMPFGFLVPMIWEYSLGRTVLAGAAFSCLIELSQIMSLRGTDVDDVIMNTLGAGIGFLCWKLLSGIKKNVRPGNVDAGVLRAAVLSLYLGRCLLFHGLGFTKLWLGE